MRRLFKHHMPLFPVPLWPVESFESLYLPLNSQLRGQESHRVFVQATIVYILSILCVNVYGPRHMGNSEIPVP